MIFSKRRKDAESARENGFNLTAHQKAVLYLHFEEIYSYSKEFLDMPLCVYDRQREIKNNFNCAVGRVNKLLSFVSCRYDQVENAFSVYSLRSDELLATFKIRAKKLEAE
ncbi:MAG: hypothetical protein FWD49_05230 [Firmicutes bacterium]|nr:hypothetical protein [Bacillota bacterium]